ncbi:unnamed protein product [Heligmosomoides polygyrus]|uniref:SH2 domain-containing protein n=1 Tax=Heligmosomoides polygyrus TaxID=6339 RepID=A0A183FXE5_HELPZ|nr:unnamed protein product [Heligmosomoides polygyrus]
MSDYDCPTTSVHNLKEQVWYRGLVTRIKSEQMLKEDGEFLVRDSISMPGEYVLTAMWNNRALHFQINTAYDNGKKQFHLEEESFASVPSLVNFYRSHRRPLTAASGCIISTPVGRDRDVGNGVEGREVEASYMHVLKPGMNQAPVPRSLSQRVLLNQTALRMQPQYAAARQQRPKSSISQHQISLASEQVTVPPVPAALANRPLPLPIRSPRNTQDDEEDYSEMDYDAMDGILDACSLSNGDRGRSSSTSSLPSVMSRQFQSCQNLTYRSNSPCTMAKIPPPLPARPPLPPRPNFKMDTSSALDEVDAEQSQPEDARDSAFVDYDEPRTKIPDDDYDKLPSTRPCSSEIERNRLSGSSDCDSADSGVRDSRDSGIYSSPSPPDEHHASLSQVHLMQLKQFLLTKGPDEISLAISHEHAKILRFLEPAEKLECKANNGLRIVLLPSGSSLRHELIERCSALRYSCLLSVLSGARKDAHLVLKKWILVGVSLARHGDAFACACVANALSERTLKNLTWLWKSLDPHAKSEYAALKAINESLLRGEKLEVHNYQTVVPFLQPTLEIMSGQDSNYLDGTSFASEFSRADGTVMAQSFLTRLFDGGASHEDRQRVLNGVVQRALDEC